MEKEQCESAKEGTSFVTTTVGRYIRARGRRIRGGLRFRWFLHVIVEEQAMSCLALPCLACCLSRECERSRVRYMD